MPTYRDLKAGSETSSNLVVSRGRVKKTSNRKEVSYECLSGCNLPFLLKTALSYFLIVCRQKELS